MLDEQRSQKKSEMEVVYQDNPSMMEIEELRCERIVETTGQQQ